MPQAIERSVATPTMKARLPARNPMASSLPAGIMPEGAPRPLRSGLVVRVQVDAELLSGVEPRMGREAVPRHDLRHAALKEPRDLRDGVALAHGVVEPAARRRAPRAARGDRQLDALPGPQGIVRVHAVQPREGVHVHAVVPRAGPDRAARGLALD